MMINYTYCLLKRYTLFVEQKLRRIGMTEGNPHKTENRTFWDFFSFDHEQKLYSHAKFCLSRSSQNVLKRHDRLKRMLESCYI